MPKLRVSHKGRRQYPIGDRDSRVSVVEMETVPTSDGQVRKRERVIYTSFMSKSSVSTRAQAELRLLDVNTSKIPTHKFVARFNPLLHSGYILQHAGQSFAIVGIDEVDGRREYQSISARLLGLSDVEAATV